MRSSLTSSLLLAFAASATAQELPRWIPGLTANTSTPPTVTAFGHTGDYRLEGLIAGAVLIGGAATFLVIAVCASSDSCETADALLISVGTIALGGLTGALIGGAIPKAPRAPPTEASLRKRASNERLLQSGTRWALLSLAWRVPR
jgi:hypothetical protein